MVFPVRHSYHTAFTLMELLIVVAIIGVLAAIAIPNLFNALVRAKVARAVSDIQSLQLAQEQYRLDQNGYPPLGVVRAARKTDGYASLPWLSSPVPYLSTIPVDPFLQSSGRLLWMGYAHLRVASNQNRIVAYTLSSTGPSKYHMLVIYWLQPEILFNQYPFMSYDPSNGLVSMGEIVAWGGDSSKIHVMMNGKEYDGQFPPDYAR